jgi:rhamnogalacturonyl hydrolase YesR
MAMVLSDFPENHPDRERMLTAYRDHMRTLVKHQDPTGCWRQVVDRPESYRELTATCMITFALVRGVRRGWLDREEFAPVIDRAWYAIRTRAPENGRLVDVCTGTGKQRDLRAYYDRQAILGPDARGGAMALMAAVELAASKWYDAAAEDKIKD